MADGRLKVLIIAPRFGTISRGVEVFAAELAKHIDKRKFEVCILSGRHNQCVDGVTLIQYPLIPRERFSFWVFKLLRLLPARWHLGTVEIEAFSLMWSARSFMRASRFDVVFPFGGSWTYRFAKKLIPGASIISVGHGGPVLSDLSLSEFFVALTPADEEKARLLLPEITTCVIPNGVNSKKFLPAAEKNGTKTRRILCVGAFTVDKRHDLLFDAVLRMDCNVILVCAGEGPLKEGFKAHPLYQQHRVEFVAQPHDAMPALYQTADVFTLASPEEAFGLVFLEALSCGLPVVAHDAARQRYVIGDTGIFCDTRSAEEYASALTKALAMTHDQKRIEHAKKFDWEAVATQYEAIMLNLKISSKKLRTNRVTSAC